MSESKIDLITKRASSCLPIVAAFVSILTFVAYIAGLFYSVDWKNYWGISGSLFPMSFEYTLLFGSSALLTLFLDNIRFCLFLVSIAVLCFMLSPLKWPAKVKNQQNGPEIESGEDVDEPKQVESKAEDKSEESKQPISDVVEHSSEPKQPKFYEGMINVGLPRALAFLLTLLVALIVLMCLLLVAVGAGKLGTRHAAQKYQEMILALKCDPKHSGEEWVAWRDKNGTDHHGLVVQRSQSHVAALIEENELRIIPSGQVQQGRSFPGVTPKNPCNQPEEPAQTPPNSSSKPKPAPVQEKIQPD